MANDFLPFGTAGGANVMSQAAYAALGARSSGFVAGTALSAQLNKAWRQSSVMAYIIGQFVADHSGEDALDDGDLAELYARFETAIRRQDLNYLGVVSGTANALTVGIDPAPGAWSELTGVPLVVITASSNTAANPTINIGGLGVKTLKQSDGTDLPIAAWRTGALLELIYDGTNVRILSGADQAAINVALNNFIIIADQKPAGTDGGDFLAGAWRTRTLNTIVADPNGLVGSGLVTLASNQITLGVGVWILSASAPAVAVNSHKTRLQNITDGTTAFTGTSEQTTQNTNTDQLATRSLLVGRIALTAPKTFEIQHIGEQNSTGFNPGVGFGLGSVYIGGTGPETYTICEIRKVG